MDLQDMVRGYEHKVGTRWDPPTPDPTILVPIELRAHLQDGCPEPEYQIRLCFGLRSLGDPRAAGRGAVGLLPCALPAAGTR